ncbi:MAG: glycosyltransferase family 4 protein [Elusimicrobia bacterium]|nr:glycosyltransferase family 4 protein [Elusimicrobiota bacterium]
MSKKHGSETRVIFLNQAAGPLFWELAEDTAKDLGCSLIITGRGNIGKRAHPALSALAAPDYRRHGYAARLGSWVHFFLFALYKVWSGPPGALLFIVSNPPFLPLLGYIMRRFRRQPYVVLVYDIYPDLLVRLGRLSEHGTVAKLWRLFNKKMLENAETVFTIGEVMAANLEKMFDASRTRAGVVTVVPNWADSELIKPMAKQHNWFARQHRQLDKLTVLYSGNFGETHDLATLLDAAKKLGLRKEIHFLLVGAGSKRSWVETMVINECLTNVTMLAFQPEETLPFLLAAGDVAVVSLCRGIEGLSVPSKTFYALAAGSALLAVVSGDNELSRLVKQNSCGLAVEPGDTAAMIAAIERFCDDKEFLRLCQRQARRLAGKDHTRRNAKAYADIIRRMGIADFGG